MATATFRKIEGLGDGNTDLMFRESLYNEENRTLINFVVLQLFVHKGIHYQIKKHDFSHGAYNVHKYYENLDSREEFRNIPLTNELYHECRRDIKNNWLNYREKFVKKYLTQTFK